MRAFRCKAMERLVHIFRGEVFTAKKQKGMGKASQKGAYDLRCKMASRFLLQQGDGRPERHRLPSQRLLICVFWIFPS